MHGHSEDFADVLLDETKETRCKEKKNNKQMIITGPMNGASQVKTGDCQKEYEEVFQSYGQSFSESFSGC